MNVSSANDNAMGADSYDEDQIIGPTIGARARIGVGAVLLPGVRIGQDAIVAAGALVTRDVPENVTVIGFPARRIARVILGSSFLLPPETFGGSPERGGVVVDGRLLHHGEPNADPQHPFHQGHVVGDLEHPVARRAGGGSVGRRGSATPACPIGQTWEGRRRAASPCDPGGSDRCSRTRPPPDCAWRAATGGSIASGRNASSSAFVAIHFPLASADRCVQRRSAADHPGLLGVVRIRPSVGEVRELNAVVTERLDDFSGLFGRAVTHDDAFPVLVASVRAPMEGIGRATTPSCCR